MRVSNTDVSRHFTSSSEIPSTLSLCESPFMGRGNGVWMTTRTTIWDGQQASVPSSNPPHDRSQLTVAKSRQGPQGASPPPSSNRGPAPEEVVSNARESGQIGGRFASNEAQVHVRPVWTSGIASLKTFIERAKKRIGVCRTEIVEAQEAFAQVQARQSAEELGLAEGEVRLVALIAESEGLREEVPPIVPANFAHELAELQGCIQDLQRGEHRIAFAVAVRPVSLLATGRWFGFRPGWLASNSRTQKMSDIVGVRRAIHHTGRLSVSVVGCRLSVVGCRMSDVGCRCGCRCQLLHKFQQK